MYDLSMVSHSMILNPLTDSKSTPLFDVECFRNIVFRKDYTKLNLKAHFWS